MPTTLPDRNNAIELLNEWVKSPNLKKHMLAVEAVMRKYAKIFKENEKLWAIVGLLHDFDYERFKSPKDHPFRGAEELQVRGYSEEIIHAVLAHAPHTGEKRDTLLKKCIYAVDELSGLIIAVALVRPSKKISEVTVEAVIKKFRERNFAKQINRDEIVLSANELGISLNDHISYTLVALQGIAPQLDL